MNYIKISENEALEPQTATNDVECFKVIEERLSPSGRYEYRTFPLYFEVHEEVINGTVPFCPKHEGKPTFEKNGTVRFEDGFVHAYKNLEDAIQYVERYGYGYPQTRTTIYRCLIPKGTTYYCTLKGDTVFEPMECYSAYCLKFDKPLLESASKAVREYKRIEKPEKKKKTDVIFRDDYDYDVEEEEFSEE